MMIIAFAPAVGRTQKLSSGSVHGRVRINSSDAGVAWVQLQHLGMTVQEQVSADGRFIFSNVPYGPYTLSIQVPGQEPVSQDISVPGEITNTDRNRHADKTARQGHDVRVRTSDSSFRTPSVRARTGQIAKRVTVRGL